MEAKAAASVGVYQPVLMPPTIIIGVSSAGIHPAVLILDIFILQRI